MTTAKVANATEKMTCVWIVVYLKSSFSGFTNTLQLYIAPKHNCIINAPKTINHLLLEAIKAPTKMDMNSTPRFKSGENAGERYYRSNSVRVVWFLLPRDNGVMTWAAINPGKGG
jgi:hypothetical protein